MYIYIDYENMARFSWMLTVSGYIPRRPFKFGDTYKIDCDYCIDDHLNLLGRRREHERVLVRSATDAEPMRPLKGDPTVRDHLNTFRDMRPAGPMLEGKTSNPNCDCCLFIAICYVYFVSRRRQKRIDGSTHARLPWVRAPHRTDGAGSWMSLRHQHQAGSRRLLRPKATRSHELQPTNQHRAVRGDLDLTFNIRP